MSFLHRHFPKVFWSLAAFGGIYAVILASLTNVNLQRQAVYVHKFHTAWYHNVSLPETFGFGKNQVTPFYLKTPDAETLFCWHILPLDLYYKHQDTITRRAAGPVEDFTNTKAFRLLRDNPESRVVINFHGNAGHVAQGWRPSAYRSIAGLPNTHTFTCDYRGFGLSTGNPTESGLITDSIALVDYVLNTLRHPAYRTLLLGQSLGTAVGAATTLHYVDPGSKLIPYDVVRPRATRGRGGPGPITFAGTVLVAPFTNLPDLLLTYRIMGFIPVLSPLRPYPRLQKMLASCIVDRWDTLSRLKAVVVAAKRAQAPLSLKILHSRNDPDISFKQAETLYEGVAEAMQESGVEQSQIDERRTRDEDKVRRGAWAYRMSEDEFVDVRQKRRLELEITRFGGHNRLAAFTPTILAIQKAFDDAAKLRQGHGTSGGTV